jgi:cytochrome c biogenesis protein CcdA/thiol-disulfide isomerase/thioredoxin
MIATLVFAWLAGVLTILAPCTLPVIPFVLGGSVGGDRRRVTGLITGFAVTFVVMTTVVTAVFVALDISTSLLRTGAVVALGLVGVTLAVPAVDDLVTRLVPARAIPGMPAVGSGDGDETARGTGFLRGFLVGSAIGVVWAPCVGPLMAAVIATAAASGPSGQGVAISVAYVAGAALPLAVIARWGHRATRGIGGRAAVRLRRGFGVAMIAASLIVLGGLDLPLQERLTAALPDGWGSALVSAGEPADDTGEPEPAAATPGVTIAPGELPDLGAAPEFTGLTAWINSDPLTMASLRGKVVLVHFWTFGCINCIHVQPYVKAWYDAYRQDGFVVVGIHSPEFAYERDVDNVREAVADADVRFPVATDPSFATWHAFKNRYWPGFAFVDRHGHVRYVSAGEGDYDVREAVIKALLAEG